MVELFSPVTEEQVKNSEWYQELERTRATIARTLAEERLGIYQTMPMPAAPDCVEVLTDAVGHILERMAFPFVMWSRRGGNLKQVQVNSLEEYWRENENSGYPILFGKGAKLKHFSKTEGNPLSLAEWVFLRRQAGTLTGSSLDAPFEALQLEPTIALDRTPGAAPIDPAAVSVGYLKDVAAINTGIGTVDVGGIVTIFAQNVRGDMFYPENVAGNKVATVTAADPIKKPIVGQIFVTAGASLKYLISCWGNQGLWILSTANVTLDGIIAQSAGLGGTGCLIQGAASHTLNNCIVIGGNIGFWQSNATLATLNHCLGIHCDNWTFYNQPNNVARGVVNNCVAYTYLDAFDFVNAWGGDYNATTAPSGAPGANSKHSLTQATARLAAWFSPSTGTNQKPWDFRNLDGGASVLQGAGTPIGGVTTDIDGRARSLVNPNIGPAEGFLGFAPVPPAVPSAAPIIG